jgi:uracil-DNA glycosylase
MNPMSMVEFNSRIVDCARCPRLVEWRESVAQTKRKAYRDWEYWGRAVPHFGDPEATRLIVGLAPAAHGANRTGRMFTGDDSGAWLFRALHRAGIANRPDSTSRDDGLALAGVVVTAVVHCAPPDNKPSNEEIAACRPFLKELLASRTWDSILCLGALAWGEMLRLSDVRPKPAFGHCTAYQTKTGALLVGSYHPSRQNTQTRKLTEPMLDEAVKLWLSR